jgi:hypothetical protein
MAIVGKLAEQIAAGAGVAAPTEHAEQCEVIRWARTHSDYLPELWLLFAVPNGGHRHPATAARLAAEGVARGVPDLCLPVPQRRMAADPAAPPLGIPGWWAGWYGELKRTKGGRVAPVQAEWHAALTARGYKVDVCYGADAMIGALCAYLGVG